MSLGMLSLPTGEGPTFKRDRSASIVWADFLTAPSDTSPYPSDDEESTYSDHKKKSGGRIDDDIFDSYCNRSGTILVGKLLAMLESTGLKRTDYRLSELITSLKKYLREKESVHKGHLHDDFVGSIETLHLTRDEFREMIIPNIFIISMAFRSQFIIPRFDLFTQSIEDIYNDCKEIKTGKVATYLNKLSKIDSELWGVSVCTIDGQRASFGDYNTAVTFHSLSKPLVYAYALHEIGKETVHKYVGQEPSGHTFNELVLDHKKRPHNPMINAGSIMIHALLQKFVQPNITSAERFDLTHELFQGMSGGEYIGFNNGMFLNKREVSDRNWALGHFMKENGCFPPDCDLADCLEYYLQTSSMEATVEVLSVIAGTLANGGICPITGTRVLNEDIVGDVLSVMFSCGMLEFSGKFAFRVGLPAKSGISGAILLVIPNVCGFAMWAPALDGFANSVRGVAFCEKLVQSFKFHCFDTDQSEKCDPTRKTLETKGSNTIVLKFSAANGDLETIFRLHLCGIDMTLYDCDGRTALHVAACEGHFDVCQYLLVQCGVPHASKDRWGNTPYDEAIQFGHMAVAELLRNWHPEKRNSMQATYQQMFPQSRNPSITIPVNVEVIQPSDDDGDVEKAE